MEQSRRTVSWTAPSRIVTDSEATRKACWSRLERTTHVLESPSMCMDADTLNATVQIRYRLVLMHGSKLSSQAWAPEGNLKHKALRDLKLEIPVITHYRKFILRLRAANFRSEEVVGTAGECEFEFRYAKGNVDIVIRFLASRQMQTQPSVVLSVFIEIEPRERIDEEDDVNASKSPKIEW
ncbi:hypothetical protein E8E12_002202 [Didymella heteroderae]|uniref:Uncharacterized protein n=1 Tax=Didymella heteroderae TaxID=1769908 RepID=A0A9P4WGR2_9PLEO|nr:hypothetical protein E8E12_002202 [Didymella heteroderae]